MSKAAVYRARGEIYILRKIASLGNPVLMSALDAYVDKKKSVVYLVMPYCNGGELFQRVHKSGRLSEQQASTIFRKLVIAIADLHNHGILHCDLKPGVQPAAPPAPPAPPVRQDDINGDL